MLVKSQLQPYIVNVVLSEPNDPSTKQMSILVYLPRTQDININLSIIINSQYIRLIGSLAIYLASSLGIDDLQSQGLVLVEVHLDGGLVFVDAQHVLEVILFLLFYQLLTETGTGLRDLLHLPLIVNADPLVSLIAQLHPVHLLHIQLVADAPVAEVVFIIL